MIEKITKWLTIVNTIAIVVIALVLVGGSQSATVGAAGDINTQTVWFVKGLTAGNPKVSVLDSSGNLVGPVVSTADGTIGGGTLTVTTSNTATSTATIGCVQTYATSTATAVRMVIGSIATSSTSYGGTNTVGLVGWQYGACPNL